MTTVALLLASVHGFSPRVISFHTDSRKHTVTSTAPLMLSRSSWAALDDGTPLGLLEKDADVVFSMIDADGDGAVTKGELCTRLSGFGYTQSSISNVFEKISADPSNSVLSLAEWRDAYIKHPTLRTAPGLGGALKAKFSADADAVFSLLDRDGNGVIESDELREYLVERSGYGEELPTKVLRAVDVDQSGGIDREEFRKAFIKYPSMRTAPGLGGDLPAAAARAVGAAAGTDSTATLRLATLKADGEATVARRTALATAYTMAALKIRGAETFARRAEMAAAYKVAALELEGAKTFTRRAEMAAAYKVAALELEGAKTIARRAEMQEALKAALEGAQTSRALPADPSPTTPVLSWYDTGMRLKSAVTVEEIVSMAPTTVSIIQATKANVVVKEAASPVPARPSRPATNLDAISYQSWGSVPTTPPESVAARPEVAPPVSGWASPRNAKAARRTLVLALVVAVAARVAGLPIRLLP